MVIIDLSLTAAIEGDTHLYEGFPRGQFNPCSTLSLKRPLNLSIALFVLHYRIDAKEMVDIYIPSVVSGWIHLYSPIGLNIRF